jgi:hypothetical protein
LLEPRPVLATRVIEKETASDCSLAQDASHNAQEEKLKLSSHQRGHRLCIGIALIRHCAAVKIHQTFAMQQILICCITLALTAFALLLHSVR